MKVGVVFGGRSVEHDVSIVTAHQVMAVLSAKHSVIPIYVTREGRWLSAPALNDLSVYREGRAEDVGEDAHIPPTAGYGGLQVAGGRLKGARKIELDVVVCSIHGTYGEDGTLQGLLEMADLPYTGSGVLASSVGMDKVAMKAAFRAAGVPVVPDVVVDTEEALPLDRIESEIGYPAFVKPARLGSSVGIGKARDRAGLESAIEVARRYDHRLLIERSMEGCIEVNCSVLGGAGRTPSVSVCEQPVAWEEFLSFSDKYMRGDKSAKGSSDSGMAAQQRRIPAPISDVLTKQVQESAVEAFQAIDASGIARIDSFVDEQSGQSWVGEINTAPGSFAFYLWEASGIAFSELMDTTIEIALAQHARRKALMFTYDSGMLERAGVKTGG